MARIATSNKSGLEQLQELAPELEARTRKLRSYLDSIDPKLNHGPTSQVLVKGSAWSNSVDNLKKANNG